MKLNHTTTEKYGNNGKGWYFRFDIFYTWSAKRFHQISWVTETSNKTWLIFQSLLFLLSADGLSPLGARPSAGTVMDKFRCHNAHIHRVSIWRVNMLVLHVFRSQIRIDWLRAWWIHWFLLNIFLKHYRNCSYKAFAYEMFLHTWQLSK